MSRAGRRSATPKTQRAPWGCARPFFASTGGVRVQATHRLRTGTRRPRHLLASGPRLSEFSEPLGRTHPRTHYLPVPSLQPSLPPSTRNRRPWSLPPATNRTSGPSSSRLSLGDALRRGGEGLGPDRLKPGGAGRPLFHPSTLSSDTKRST